MVEDHMDLQLAMAEKTAREEIGGDVQGEDLFDILKRLPKEIKEGRTELYGRTFLFTQAQLFGGEVQCPLPSDNVWVEEDNGTTYGLAHGLEEFSFMGQAVEDGEGLPEKGAMEGAYKGEGKDVEWKAEGTFGGKEYRVFTVESEIGTLGHVMWYIKGSGKGYYFIFTFLGQLMAQYLLIGKELMCLSGWTGQAVE